MQSQTMMIYASEWNGKVTFKMLPLSYACPYAECIFEPESRTLAVITNNMREKPHMVIRIDDNGDPVRKKNAKNGDDYKQERRFMDAPYEHYLTDLNDIEAFLKFHAVNPDHPVALMLLAPIEVTPPATT